MDTATIRARAEIERRKRGEAVAMPLLWRFPYRFYGNNQRFYDCRDTVCCFGGPAEVGKTITALCKLHRLACEHPGMIGVIMRKVREDATTTVLRTWEDKILPRPDGEDAPYRSFWNGKSITVLPYGGKNPQWYEYSNGSRIYVGGMDRPGKVLSGEPDIVYVNQAEELNQEQIETLMTRVTGRGGRMKGHPSQLMMDCNPGGGKHPIKLMEATGALTLINGRHRDNPILYDQATGEMTEQGRRSLGILGTLTGVRLQRLYHGNWAGADGLYFANFDTDIHGLDDVPGDMTDWQFWGSLDYGFNHWNIFQLHAKNSDGVIITLHEVCHRQHYPKEIAPDIKGVLERYGLSPSELRIYTGADTFAKTGHNENSVADQYRTQGINLTAWDSSTGSRQAKAHFFSRLLGNPERKQPPQWYYVRQNCKRLAETLPGLVPDPANPETVKKVDCNEHGDGGDDSYDCLVGGLYLNKISSMA